MLKESLSTSATTNGSQQAVRQLWDWNLKRMCVDHRSYQDSSNSVSGWVELFVPHYPCSRCHQVL